MLDFSAKVFTLINKVNNLHSRCATGGENRLGCTVFDREQAVCIESKINSAIGGIELNLNQAMGSAASELSLFSFSQHCLLL